jgi:hypothetical protein
MELQDRNGGLDRRSLLRTGRGPLAARIRVPFRYAELLGSGTVVCGYGAFASSISISFRPLGDAASSRARAEAADFECPESGQSNRIITGWARHFAPVLRRVDLVGSMPLEPLDHTLAVGARRRSHVQLAPFRDALASNVAGWKVPEARAHSVRRWCVLPSGVAT